MATELLILNSKPGAEGKRSVLQEGNTAFLHCKGPYGKGNA